jgi:hypothetical protein
MLANDACISVSAAAMALGRSLQATSVSPCCAHAGVDSQAVGSVRRLRQATTFTPPSTAPLPSVPPLAPPSTTGYSGAAAGGGAGGGGKPGKNLTVVFFECCESPASQGAWDTVELRWRLVDGDKNSDRFATVKLVDNTEGSKFTGTCKAPMDCEQYIATPAGGGRVYIPAGVAYWTRLAAAAGAAGAEELDWQYQGIAYDGDMDDQLEVLVCGSMTTFESSAWYAYTCDAVAACSIVAHPCCLSGNCVTGDEGAGGVRQSGSGAGRGA